MYHKKYHMQESLKLKGEIQTHIPVHYCS